MIEGNATPILFSIAVKEPASAPACTSFPEGSVNDNEIKMTWKGVEMVFEKGSLTRLPTIKGRNGETVYCFRYERPAEIRT